MSSRCDKEPNPCNCCDEPGTTPDADGLLLCDGDFAHLAERARMDGEAQSVINVSAVRSCRRVRFLARAFSACPALKIGAGFSLRDVIRSIRPAIVGQHPAVAAALYVRGL
jgi:hypothetical protein